MSIILFLLLICGSIYLSVCSVKDVANVTDEEDNHGGRRGDEIDHGNKISGKDFYLFLNLYFEQLNQRIRIKRLIFCLISSDGGVRGYHRKHRRGKSETLRVQYINTKDIK